MLFNNTGVYTSLSDGIDDIKLLVKLNARNDGLICQKKLKIKKIKLSCQKEFDTHIRMRLV